ncbi:phosphate acyltransferase, partial [Acinetobacter baumannii]
MARYAYRSGASMKPVFTAAKSARKRVIYAEGEEDRVLRAAQVVVDEGLAEPVLLGRPDVIERQIEHMRLRLKAGTNCEIV